MNFMNRETQHDLPLAGSKEFGLLLKLIFYNPFEVITGFLCLFNQRTRFKSQFHNLVSLVEKTFQTANKQGRAERKLLHASMGYQIFLPMGLPAPSARSSAKIVQQTTNKLSANFHAIVWKCTKTAKFLHLQT